MNDTSSTALVEPGIRELRILESQASQAVKRIRLAVEDLIRIRFKQGAIIHKLLSGSSYGSSAASRIAEQSGMALSVVYECRAFYLYEPLNRCERGLEAWLVSSKEQGELLSWRRCRVLSSGKTRSAREESRQRCPHCDGRGWVEGN